MKKIVGYNFKTTKLKSLIVGSLLSLAGISLFAKECRITVSAIAESSPGCNDGALVVKTKPSGQCILVTVNPGNYEFKVTTPAVLRPEGTPGFPAGDYSVKVKLAEKKKVVVKKCVEIPVAEYSVTVSSQDAHCACNGSFVTTFNNPDNADVTVTYQATDSLGNVIGTTGDYINLCPGIYAWTVQANSKSPACNEKVVFKDSGTVTIAGSGTIPPTPTLIPGAQSVAPGTSFTLTATPVITGATYVLSTPTRGDITQTSNVFVLPNATGNDQGPYTVRIISGGCTSATSDPAQVTAGCLAFTLQPTNGTQTPTGGTGSILVTVTNGVSPFSALYNVNGSEFTEVTTPTFTIPKLTSGSYNIFIIEGGPIPCEGFAGPVTITNTPIPVATRKLDPPVLPKVLAPCTGTPPAVTISGTTFVPLGGTLTLTANVSNDTNPLTYIWVGPNGFGASGKTITVDNASSTQTGTFTVQVTDTVTGCVGLASINVTVGLASALGLTNSSSKSVCPYSTTSFVLTVTNYAAGTATNVVLTDVFSNCVSLVSATGSQWSISTTNNELTAVMPSLAPGASASVTVTVQVNCRVGTFPTGTATVTSDTSNPVSAVATMKVKCCKDLRCKKKKRKCRR